MLTRQGWLVAAGGLLLNVGGWLLGVPELWVLGTAALVLVLVSLVLVVATRLRLEVSRDLSPPKVHAGTASRVELRIRNRAPRRTPVLRLLDPVSGTRGAELFLAPLDAGDAARAAYRLPTERRGILRVGPLQIVVDDPFGLASSSVRAAPRTELTIFPRIDDIVALPHTTGHDPHAGAEHPTALGRTGEDFYGLRQYVVGDDMRRVHWPSTARRDDLMVRQDELPWQGRVVVLLDVRRTTNTPASLELAVSAAASIVTTSWRRRDLVRLVSTDGFDSGFAAGTAHAEAVMEHLATVQATPSGNFRGALALLGRSTSGGSLAAIVADIPEAELHSLGRLRGAFGAIDIVHLHASAWDRTAPLPPAASAPGVLRVTRELPFAEAWNAAMTGRRRRGGGERAVPAGVRA